MTGVDAPFELIEEGILCRCEPGGPWHGACMPRCVRRESGELVCSFAFIPPLGVNGFVTMLVRSADGGRTWSAPEHVWPRLEGRYSLGCSLSAGPDGRLYLFGFRTPIDQPGEPMWCDATQGLKENDPVWAVSADNGRTWSDPAPIPKPFRCAVEVPGALCVTRRGEWLAPISVYNTFDPAVKPAREQVLAARSSDQGQSWEAIPMLKFAEPDSGGAEAWVCELADGRLLGASWHIDHVAQKKLPNKFALSHDGGRTWQPTRSTGTLGNTVFLTPLADGRAVFGYVDRNPESVGIVLAIVRPTDDDLGIEATGHVFRAASATQSGGAAQHDAWVDFNFGEPGLTILPDRQALLVWWSIEPNFSGCRWRRLRLP